MWLAALLLVGSDAFLPSSVPGSQPPRHSQRLATPDDAIDAEVTLPKVEAAVAKLRALAADCGLCGLDASAGQKKRINEAITELTQLAGPATARADSIDGAWTLLYSDAPDIVVRHPPPTPPTHPPTHPPTPPPPHPPNPPTPQPPTPLYLITKAIHIGVSMFVVLKLHSAILFYQ